MLDNTICVTEWLQNSPNQARDPMKMRRLTHRQAVAKEVASLELLTLAKKTANNL